MTNYLNKTKFESSPLGSKIPSGESCNLIAFDDANIIDIYQVFISIRNFFSPHGEFY